MARRGDADRGDQPAQGPGGVHGAAGSGPGPDDVPRSQSQPDRPAWRDVATQIAGTSQLRGREVYTAQLGLALARTMSLGANLNLIDPHGANFSRPYDLTLTKDFGRGGACGRAAAPCCGSCRCSLYQL